MEKKLDQWKSVQDALQAYLRARDCSWDSPVDSDGVQVSSSLDVRGRELPDETPIAPPVGYSAGPSLADFVQRMIRTEVSRIAADNEYESFEEGDDFDIDDDPVDPLTPYEQHFMPQQPPVPEKSPLEGGGGSVAPQAPDPVKGEARTSEAPSSGPPMPSPLAKSPESR